MEKTSAAIRNMLPLNDAVFSHMSTILARSPTGFVLAAYIAAGILGLIALLALFWAVNVKKG